MTSDPNHSDEDSWSESSASSSRSDIATSTMLGLPDGLITLPSDLSDPQVSHLGGRPSFLTGIKSVPNLKEASCPSCEQGMELLVQLYAPLEGTEDDRVVYVFGCARGGCQGEGGKGSVRAFTSVKRSGSSSTTQKLEEIDQARVKVGQLQLSDKTVDSAWTETSAYPAQYLETETEYLTKTKSSKAAEQTSLDAASAAASSGKKIVDEFDFTLKESGIPGLDETLERFLGRLNEEPEQVVRYDFGGNPLAYSSTSKLHQLLYQTPPLPTGTLGSTSGPKRKVFDPTRIPRCDRCGADRAFELQLTPGLLTILRVQEITNSSSLFPTGGESIEKSDTDKKNETDATEKEEEEARRRQAEVHKVLEKKDREVKTGMEWGTICVFSCVDGCGGEWGQEWVGVEWEE
ncbi:Uncharacterized MYND Zn-finger protein [Phaffia rhodozyma]|uniref:Uncharacterized MYND Zn-finger protein n=1 Tax=Phaffia rhodozyma TaxID=264483 RepID=A0A0F7STG7_PHARH|nr:Uncharacterized MYND Zn-finger protein [Phaffia rhodozyma]